MQSTLVEAQLFRRGDGGDGAWPSEPETSGPGGTVHLTSIGLALPVAENYRGTHLA